MQKSNSVFRSPLMYSEGKSVGILAAFVWETKTNFKFPQVPTNWNLSHGDYMIRRSLRCDWTEDDRLARATWMRGVGIFYGCLALLVLGAIALIKPSSVAPNEAADRQTWGAGLQGERVIAMPACRGQRDESCTNPRTRE